MPAGKRLSICYVVPGHDLMATMGPTRNVLNLAHELARLADVTVAFRRLADERAPQGLRLVEIDPGPRGENPNDSALNGMSYGDFVKYLQALRGFARRELRGFDVILEKSWLLSGYLSSLCRTPDTIGVPVENIVPNPRHAARREWTKLLRLRAGRFVAGRALRRAPLIIAETEFLRREIAQYWRVPAARVAVVDLGVDRSIFQPLDQTQARSRLDIARDTTVLTYIGVLDWTHDLEPVMHAMHALGKPNLELHVVGDGARRCEYQTLGAAGNAKIVFHGKVPHAEVPWHIAAADLCLAPYDAGAFASGELGYSTMKIPEYLSVGRPVVSVPSGRIRSLVKDGETGFLFANEMANWRALLLQLPSREQLAAMGAAAARTPLPSWEDTARNYLSLCERELARLQTART